MSHALLLFVCMFSWENELALLLSVLILIGFCLWPNPSNILLTTIAVFELLKSTPHLAYAVEQTTFFKVLHSVRMGALFGALLYFSGWGNDSK